ncbi:MAG: protein-export protein SecB [Candidatus Pelagibacter sp. TMED165]|nr:MAG: protein-export protein SecB [Candidatus Pelagibacter sp. TMED165]
MSFKIVGKYIKKIDFNIPNHKTFFLLTKDISSYKVNIDIKSEQIKEKILEVQTTLSLLSNDNKEDKIETKLVYSSIVELEKQIDNKKEIEKIILIDVPTKIYPELRKIFILIFESSGFKDIKINKDIDFQKLYDSRKIQ